MSRLARIRAEAATAWRSFLRRRTAVFFTFLFPAILVGIFGALVRTEPGSGGLFAEPTEYYVAGYVGVIVLFTPLSRVSSTVARAREHQRFEKLATTPLTRGEWIVAHAAVNVAVVALATVLIGTLVVLLTGASLGRAWLLPVYLVPGVLAFVGVGAVLGRLSDSRDGAVAASNALGLPLLFLSDTFVAPAQLPGWFRPLLELSPLTYFARGSRAAMYPELGGAPLWDLAVLVGVAVLALWLGARAVPWTD